METCGVRILQVVINGDGGGAARFWLNGRRKRKQPDSVKEKRKAEEAEKTSIAPGVAARQLKRYEAALIEPLQCPPVPLPVPLTSPLVPWVPTSFFVV